MEDDAMTTKEMSRLATWLMNHGHTEREALECLKYIAGETALPEKGEEEGHAPNRNESVT